MPRIRGIGGVFFKSPNPERLYAWYEKHLGIAGKPGQGAMFPWRNEDGSEREDMTVWSIFPESSTYFGSTGKPFMLNYIVEDLDGMLEALRADGVDVDPKVERSDYGDFGWVTDPDGNRIELWEPKP